MRNCIPKTLKAYELSSQGKVVFQKKKKKKVRRKAPRWRKGLLAQAKKSFFGPKEER